MHKNVFPMAQQLPSGVNSSVKLAARGPGPPHYQGFAITFMHYTVGLLWTSDQPRTGTLPLPDNTQHSQETDIMPWAGFEASGRRPKRQTALPLGSAMHNN